jgi:hypothetical protein
MCWGVVGTETFGCVDMLVWMRRRDSRKDGVKEKGEAIEKKTYTPLAAC